MHWNNNAHWLVYNVIMHSALVPSALAVYGGLSGQWLRVSVVLCAIPQAIIVFVTLSQSFGQLVRSFVTGVKAKLRSIRDIGLNTFLELEWSRLQVPSLLRTFWVVRLVQQLTVSLGTLALSAGKCLFFSHFSFAYVSTTIHACKDRAQIRDRPEICHIRLPHSLPSSYR